jgi:gas vesicle protein
LKIDFSIIEDKVKNLESIIEEKLGGVDHYVGDLKDALTETAREILEEAEKKSNGFESVFQTEVAKTESKIESMLHFWEEEISKNKTTALQSIDSLNERLQGIHIQGADLLGKFKEEYEDSRRRLENYLQAQEGSLAEESKHAQKELTDKFLHLKKSADDFFSRQELKVEKINETIDAKISKQLAKLVDKGNLHIGQIEEKVHKHIASLKKDLEESFRDNKEEFESFKKDIDKGIE